MRHADGARSMIAAVLSLLIWIMPISAAPDDRTDGATTGPGQDWLTSNQDRIATAEYEITRHASGYQAPNRAQGFRAHFTASEIRLTPRTERSEPWQWSLALTSYGRDGVMRSVPDGELSVEGARLENVRTELTEWFVNDRRGLEHGFTVTVPPEGAPESMLRLDLRLTGELSAVVSNGGRSIDFVSPSGERVLTYSKLQTWDATGRMLDASMGGFAESGIRGVRILVDDRQAVYPLTIDPLVSAAQWTLSGPTNALFAFELVTAGDVNGDGYSDIFAGARAYNNYTGRGLVYHGSPDGPSVTADWESSGDPNSVTLFGISGGPAGDVNGDGYGDVIVGEHLYSVEVNQAGRAYVFHGSPAGLSPIADWTFEGDQVAESVGISSAPAGDVNGDGYADVIVGAPWWSNGEFREGGAFLFFGSATGLSSSPDWIGESNQANDLSFDTQYAVSVGTAGDVNGDGYSDIIVGAPGSFAPLGRAFVYHGSASGPSTTFDWMVEADQGRVGADTVNFGSWVGTAGDVNGDGYSDVYVNAPMYNDGQIDEGKVFVYHGSAAGLATTESWSATGDETEAYLGDLGAGVADYDGDGYADLAVGMRFPDSSPEPGRARVYRGSPSGLSLTPSQTFVASVAGTGFGGGIGTAGDVDGDGFADLAIGAWVPGEVYVYRGSASGLAASALSPIEGDQTEAWLGYSAGSAGDVNGDGYGDVIVGAPAYDNGQAGEGIALIYHGSPSGISGVADWVAEGDQVDAGFGSVVGTAGDTDGDGFADVVVGAQEYDNGEANEGAVFVFRGSPSGLDQLGARLVGAPSNADWSAESDQAEADFGVAAATAGDVNGDGFADVIVGATGFDNGESEEGAAFLYLGSPTGLSLIPSWTAEGQQDGSAFGVVDTAGDVNRDGYSDVIVGARLFDGPEIDEGRAWVYLGTASGLATTPAWTAEPDQAGAQFAESVGGAGDVNGDGFADVIVGARLWDNDVADEGAAFVYLGSSSGLASSAAWIAESDQGTSQFGRRVGGAGDVNDDGYADVIVAARNFDNGQNNEGSAFVYHGSASGPSPVPGWIAESNQGGARFGQSVASAGDVNGDGYADVIVGAYRYNAVQNDEGSVFVYLGNDGGGPSLRPRQRQADDLAAIGRLGETEAPTSFRSRLMGLSPFGRTRARLEVETKMLGSPFDLTNTAIGNFWTDTGLTGVELDQPVTDLWVGTPYRWRVRARYDQASHPYSIGGPWMTIPEGGWNETDFRTPPVGAGSAGSGATPLAVGKGAGSQIILSWGGSCVATDLDYAVYEGTIGNFTSHVPVVCSTAGSESLALTPEAGDRYFLVVANNDHFEGSYGMDHMLVERPASSTSCFPQAVGDCD